MANIKAKVIALADLTDVNSSGQTDGAILQYNATSSKYEVKTQLNNSNLQITGGTY